MEHTFSEHVLTGRSKATGNFGLAIFAGLAASVFGSLVWMGIALATGWQVDFLALGVAVLVGGAIHLNGKGSHLLYGVLGIFFTFLGCLVGEIGVAIVQSSSNLGWDYYRAFKHVHWGELTLALIGQITPLMGVVYAVSAFLAYKLSINK